MLVLLLLALLLLLLWPSSFHCIKGRSVKSFSFQPTRNGNNVKYKSSKNVALIRYLITFAQAQRRFPQPHWIVVFVAFESTAPHTVHSHSNTNACSHKKNCETFVPSFVRSLRSTERQLIFFAIYFQCSQWKNTDKQLIITSLIIFPSHKIEKSTQKTKFAEQRMKSLRTFYWLLSFVRVAFSLILATIHHWYCVRTSVHPPSLSSGPTHLHTHAPSSMLRSVKIDTSNA